MTEKTLLAPIPLPSATDQVFDILSRAIISLELKPGTRVSEVEIAKQLNVSRQPVRDAFFRLSKQGFIVIQPQRATLITKISERAVKEAVFIRTALEVACIHAALPLMTTDDLNDLQKILDDQQISADKKDSNAFHELDQAFHKRICEISGYELAWQLIQEQKAHVDRVRLFTLPHDAHLAHDEHSKIFEALKKRNAKQSELAMRQHLKRIPSLLPKIRLENSQYFEEE